MGEPKTNALRLLDAKNIKYKAHTYSAPEGFLDGMSVAIQLDMDPAFVYKTLVTQGNSGEYYVCVIPVSCELDLKKAAKHFGEKKLEMIPAKEITKITGYKKGGCSPIGMKKLYQTVVDQTVLKKDVIAVSGGKVGLQVELPVEALLEITKAHTVDLVFQGTKGI
ncbi:MAG: Cys-tRNA(Pro) deacylase [Eubacteriales bacterium]|nr:Cys-tRNA(Pro) deacylase [Eubacteriales bacterium]